MNAIARSDDARLSSLEARITALELQRPLAAPRRMVDLSGDRCGLEAALARLGAAVARQDPQRAPT